jgi:hypothetical protein
MALIVQRAGGQGQGNANTRLYPLANAQYGPGGAKVFHDITSGNNMVRDTSGLLIGFTCTTGYDLVTGLGSVDANVLVNNWTVPPGQTYQLAVTKFYRGRASGSVSPNSGVITWSGNTGTANYFSSTLVTLTANPYPGYVLAGWTGCSSMAGRTCNVEMNSNKSVTATFAPDISPIINFLLLD